MADLIRARFIHKILQEEGGRFLDRQTSQIQAKVKETQDKVNKKKAALLRSRQREKNW